MRTWMIDKGTSALGLLVAFAVLVAALAALGGIMELIDWIDGEFITSGTPDSVQDDIRDAVREHRANP